MYLSLTFCGAHDKNQWSQSVLDQVSGNISPLFKTNNLWLNNNINYLYESIYMTAKRLLIKYNMKKKKNSINIIDIIG